MAIAVVAVTAIAVTIAAANFFAGVRIARLQAIQDFERSRTDVTYAPDSPEFWASGIVLGDSRETTRRKLADYEFKITARPRSMSLDSPSGSLVWPGTVQLFERDHGPPLTLLGHGDAPITEYVLIYFGEAEQAQYVESRVHTVLPVPRIRLVDLKTMKLTDRESLPWVPLAEPR